MMYVLLVLEHYRHPHLHHVCLPGGRRRFASGTAAGDCSSGRVHPAGQLAQAAPRIGTGARSHLQSFFEQDYPEFEIIFCARSDRGSRVWKLPGESPLAIPDSIQIPLSGNALRQRQGVVAGAHAECRGAPVFGGQRQRCFGNPRLSARGDGAFSRYPVGLVTCLYRGVGGKVSGRGWKRLGCRSRCPPGCW